MVKGLHEGLTLLGLVGLLIFYQKIKGETVTIIETVWLFLTLIIGTFFITMNGKVTGEAIAHQVLLQIGCCLLIGFIPLYVYWYKQRKKQHA